MVVEARWINGKCARLLSEQPRFEPWRGHCVVFLGKTLAVTVPLSIKVYEWVPANLKLRDKNTPSRFMLLKPEIS